MVNFLLQNANDHTSSLALKRDLPQILSSEKMNIKDLVNLTEILENELLPNLGDEKIKYKYISNYNSSFFCQDLIINDIIANYENNSHINSLESLVNINYEYINFYEIIQKIKIDIILDRKSNLSEHTKYLDYFKNTNPRDINNIDDLFLAQLIEKNLESQNFVESKTV